MNNYTTKFLLITAICLVSFASQAADGYEIMINNSTDVRLSVSSKVNPEVADKNISCPGPDHNQWMRLRTVPAGYTNVGTKSDWKLKVHPCNTRVRIGLQGKGGHGVMDIDDGRWFQINPAQDGKIRTYKRGKIIIGDHWCWSEAPLPNGSIYLASVVYDTFRDSGKPEYDDEYKHPVLLIEVLRIPPEDGFDEASYKDCNLLYN